MEYICILEALLLIFFLGDNMKELKIRQKTHCASSCRMEEEDHCGCPYECGLWMVYDGCKEYKRR